MKKVRGQHLVTLTYDNKTEPDIANLKADVKRLLSYIKWLSDRQKGWSAKIDVYFSCVTKDLDGEWTVKARSHAHLIVDSIPGSSLMNVVKSWWTKRYGFVSIRDIQPTQKDFTNCLNYCTSQATASKIGRTWNRVIGSPLPLLKLESFQNPTDLGTVSVDATNELRYLIDIPSAIIDSIILSLFLIYQSNPVSTNPIDSHTLLNFLYPAKVNSDLAINDLPDDLSDGMVDSDPIMSFITSFSDSVNQEAYCIIKDKSEERG